jgi:hypothetical protein
LPCRGRTARERWRHYREIQPPQSRPRNPPRSLFRPRWEASRRRRRNRRHGGGASLHRRSRRHRAIRPPQNRPRNPPWSLLRPRWGASRRRRRRRRHCGGALRCRHRSRRHCAIRPPQNRPRNPPRSLPRPRWGASRRCRHAGRALRYRVRPHHLELLILKPDGWLTCSERGTRSSQRRFGASPMSSNSQWSSMTSSNGVTILQPNSTPHSL